MGNGTPRTPSVRRSRYAILMEDPIGQPKETLPVSSRDFSFRATISSRVDGGAAAQIRLGLVGPSRHEGVRYCIRLTTYRQSAEPRSVW